MYGNEGEDHTDVAKQLVDKFGLEVVVITLRETPSVWRNRWSVFAYSDGKVYRSPVCHSEMVDRLGGGDSCSAGFLYVYLELKNLQEAVEFGGVFSALKHSVPGNLAFVSKAEVEKLMRGRERGLTIERSVTIMWDKAMNLIGKTPMVPIIRVNSADTTPKVADAFSTAVSTSLK